jgi:hypothetical protein
MLLHFPQWTLGKPLSKPQVTVANLIKFSPKRIGMHAENKRLARERLTMTRMIGIYCSAHHDSPGDILCAACREFLNYAEVRLQKCPYGEDKPTCANCPVHCYKPARKAQVTEIMRTSWMVSERPGTHVSSRASKDCTRERNDKRPSPVYYPQPASTIMDGLSNHLTELISVIISLQSCR